MIFDVLMALMDEKPYGRITVSDITEKAGIARQTFYRNYEDKCGVLFEYIKNLINTGILHIKRRNNAENQEKIVLVFNYYYLINQRERLKKILSIADIEKRLFFEIQNMVFDFLKSLEYGLSKRDYLAYRYRTDYQIAGILRAFLDWFFDDMPLPTDAFISMINDITACNETPGRDVPNVVICIGKEPE